MSTSDTKRGKSAVYSRYIRRKANQKINQTRDTLDAMSQVRKLRAELELLTSYSNDVIYRLRYDSMSYDYISPSIARLLGFSSAEMKHMNLRSRIKETRIVTDGMRRVRSFDQLEENRRRGDVAKWQADYLVQTKDGRMIWVSDVSYPWFDRAGNIIGSVGSLRDISDRIAAEDAAKEELTRLANHDPLTDIANRRVFFERVEDELKRNKRNGGHTTVLLIDIDHFKKVNDRFGHDVGDHVIVEVSRIIERCLRETDMVARLGGEEYGVLLPDTATEGGFWVAERIRNSVAKHNFAMDTHSEPIGCTVSIGVAENNDVEATEPTMLYKMADTRLYIAKNTGRNQVSTDEIVAFH